MSSEFERGRQRDGGQKAPSLDDDKDPLAELKLKMALERRIVARKAERAASGGAPKIPEGGGNSLDGNVKQRMEKQLGADLSGVRVHTGGESTQAARGFGARAFTVGSDVHFNAGEFKPGTKEGDRLLAHELTHVVQGQGSPAPVARKAEEGEGGEEETGGAEMEVSQPGDVAEKEADAVADHAADDLHAEGEEKGDAEGGGGEGEGGEGEGEGGKKKKGAKEKTDKPKINAKLEGVGRKIYRLAGPTQGVAVQPGLPGAGGSYGAALGATGGARDANLNPADKVALEGELAGGIMRNAEGSAAPVFKVSRNILRYVKERDDQVKEEISRTIQMMVGEPPYFGRMGDDPKTKGPIYAASLQAMLESGEGPLPQHIGAHGQFLTNVYSKDVSVVKEQGKTLVNGKGKEILQSKMAGFEGDVGARDPKELKDPNQQVGLQGTENPAGGGPMTAQPFKDRGRENVNPNAGAVNNMQGLAPAGGNANVDVGAGNAQAHQRGTDVWQTQETNLFLQHARLVLDMPMSGGGISGTTAELMQCARIMGVTEKTELTQYGLACFAHLGAAGAHSFHEVMTVVGMAGGEYKPGDYTVALSMIPPAEKERLMKDPRFAAILGGAPPPAAAPGGAAPGAAPGGGGPPR